MYFNSYSKIGEGKELSNFYPHVFSLRLKCGRFRFLTAEGAYQLLKHEHVNQTLAREYSGLHGSEAKDRGKAIVRRVDWELVKVAAMRHVLEAKFTVPTLQDILLKTGDEPLYHLSPWDGFWGIRNIGFADTGQNMLGRILMEIRERAF